MRVLSKSVQFRDVRQDQDGAALRCALGPFDFQSGIFYSVSPVHGLHAGRPKLAKCADHFTSVANVEMGIGASGLDHNEGRVRFNRGMDRTDDGLSVPHFRNLVDHNLAMKDSHQARLVQLPVGASPSRRAKAARSSVAWLDLCNCNASSHQAPVLAARRPMKRLSFRSKAL